MRKQKQEEYRGHRTAGILLSEEILPGMKALSSEQELPQLYIYHAFDKAHLVMLAEESLIPCQDAVKMLLTLREMEKEGIEKVRLAVGGGMHSGEYYLIRRLGEEVGGRIHLARSSADLEAVGTRVKMRDGLLALLEGVNAVRGEILQLATDHVDTIMPGYDHNTHGQPITFSHWLLLWANVLKRDFKRLSEVYATTNMSPAGAVVLTGSNFALNRHRTAELLGFDEVLRNTLDACQSWDFGYEVLSAVAILHMNMARWADDILLWSSCEFGMVDYPDRFYGTSSIMMQMKSPYVPENIKGAAAHTVAGQMLAFLVLKAPTMWPTIDMLYIKETLWRSLEYAVRDLKTMTALVPEIKVNKELMKERAGMFWATVTDIAGALVRDKQLPWRTAHQIVAILVRLCRERGIQPNEVTTKLLDEAAVEYMGDSVGLSEDNLRKALDPVEFVRSRTLYGGTAPEEARAQIKELMGQLEKENEMVNSIRTRLVDANQKLETAIDTLIAKHSGRG